MKTRTLNTGYEMPLVGFGTYQLTDPKADETAIITAIESGYRLIDTAQAYKNEEIVGKALSHCQVPRNDLFITTKIWFSNFPGDKCRKSLEESLRKLDLDYVDLVLLHWPYNDVYQAWRSLEKAQHDGLVRSIGVSNFMPSQLIDLICFNDVTPAVNQVETHLYCQYRELQNVMRRYGVAHQAYSPSAATATWTCIKRMPLRRRLKNTVRRRTKSRCASSFSRAFPSCPNPLMPTASKTMRTSSTSF